MWKYEREAEERKAREEREAQDRKRELELKETEIRENRRRHDEEIYRHTFHLYQTSCIHYPECTMSLDHNISLQTKLRLYNYNITSIIASLLIWCGDLGRDHEH